MCCGEIRRSLAILASSPAIGTASKKKLEHDFVAKLCGGMKCGVSELLSRVHVRTALEETRHRSGVTNGGSRMNRCDAKRILCRRIHIRATIDESLCQLRMTKEDRQPDRRKSIFAVRIEQGGIGAEHPQRLNLIAERARLAKRHRCAAIEKVPRQIAVTVVDRKEDGRDAVLPRVEEYGIAIEQCLHALTVVLANGIEELVLRHTVLLGEEEGWQTAYNGYMYTTTNNVVTTHDWLTE